MKKIQTILPAYLLPFLLFSCAPKKPQGNPGYKPAAQSNCELPDQQWMIVRNGYDSKTVIDLATKFEVAAKIDAENLKILDTAKVSAIASFTSKFSEIVKANSYQGTEVSREFYENYRSKRDVICAIQIVLKDITIDPEERKRIQSLYTDLFRSWANIREQEQKKQ